MDNKYLIDSKENKEFMLTNALRLLEFGRRFPAPGGSSYYLGEDGTPCADKPRETWITSRMAHVYSIGAMLGTSRFKGQVENGTASFTEGLGSGRITAMLDPSYCAVLAKRAIDGLRGELHDAEHGGWYSGITADGGILPDKMCYAHAFVILAASSALCAGIEGAKELLDEALATFDKYFWDEKEGMTFDTWNTEFTKLDPYRGLNANMHTVEAFLAASDATGNNAYRDRAGRIIDRVIAWAGENNYRIPEHYDENWNPQNDLNKDNPADPFKPYGVTPGHGIEWARLIAQWAVSTYKNVNNSSDTKSAGISGNTGLNGYEGTIGNKQIGMDESATGNKGIRGGENESITNISVSSQSIKDRKNKLFMGHYIDIAAKLYGRAVDDAWCADGAAGLVYTTDLDGRPIIHDRMHWTLAEAINTSAVLYRVTGEDRYAFDFGVLLEYLDKHVMDHENGSWFHQLDSRNNVLTTVWPGKPDIYHAFQAMMIPYLEVGVSIASAVKSE
jgi:mannose/cellobiose epimerase-like protein (N-acyl-D-glucosamine 2-epimerase family)